jgi:hypothetical protein
MSDDSNGAVMIIVFRTAKYADGEKRKERLMGCAFLGG